MKEYLYYIIIILLIINVVYIAAFMALDKEDYYRIKCIEYFLGHRYIIYGNLDEDNFLPITFKHRYDKRFELEFKDYFSWRSVWCNRKKILPLLEKEQKELMFYVEANRAHDDDRFMK